MVDDVADGCLSMLFELVIEGLFLGTGYGILKLFGRGRGDRGWTGFLAWALVGLVWFGLGTLAYWLLTRA
jgi:hypothetical protein